MAKVGDLMVTGGLAVDRHLAIGAKGWPARDSSMTGFDRVSDRSVTSSLANASVLSDARVKLVRVG